MGHNISVKPTLYLYNLKVHKSVAVFADLDVASDTDVVELFYTWDHNIAYVGVGVVKLVQRLVETCKIKRLMERCPDKTSPISF